VEQSGSPDHNRILLGLLQNSVSEKKAAMAFAVEHTTELVQIIRQTDKKTQPIAVQLALDITVCFETLKKQLEDRHSNRAWLQRFRLFRAHRAGAKWKRNF